ncbi:hypothetical protein FRB99_002531 [Tulasnella sp. 403]|nr:hypothetical protein FRB99_002531 [Tulasnella sp. 403]
MDVGDYYRSSSSSNSSAMMRTMGTAQDGCAIEEPQVLWQSSQMASIEAIVHGRRDIGKKRRKRKVGMDIDGLGDSPDAPIVLGTQMEEDARPPARRTTPAHTAMDSSCSSSSSPSFVGVSVDVGGWSAASSSSSGPPSRASSRGTNHLRRVSSSSLALRRTRPRASGNASMVEEDPADLSSSSVTDLGRLVRNFGDSLKERATRGASGSHAEGGVGPTEVGTEGQPPPLSRQSSLSSALLVDRTNRSGPGSRVTSRTSLERTGSGAVTFGNKAKEHDRAMESLDLSPASASKDVSKLPVVVEDRRVADSPEPVDGPRLEPPQQQRFVQRPPAAQPVQPSQTQVAPLSQNRRLGMTKAPATASQHQRSCPSASASLPRPNDFVPSKPRTLGIRAGIGSGPMELTKGVTAAAQKRPTPFKVPFRVSPAVPASKPSPPLAALPAAPQPAVPVEKSHTIAKEEEKDEDGDGDVSMATTAADSSFSFECDAEELERMMSQYE